MLQNFFPRIIISNSGFEVCDFFFEKMSYFVKYFCTRQIGDKRILIRKARDGSIKKPRNSTSLFMFITFLFSIPELQQYNIYRYYMRIYTYNLSLWWKSSRIYLIQKIAFIYTESCDQFRTLLETFRAQNFKMKYVIVMFDGK